MMWVLSVEALTWAVVQDESAYTLLTKYTQMCSWQENAQFISSSYQVDLGLETHLQVLLGLFSTFLVAMNDLVDDHDVKLSQPQSWIEPIIKKMDRVFNLKAVFCCQIDTLYPVTSPGQSQSWMSPRSDCSACDVFQERFTPKCKVRLATITVILVSIVFDLRCLRPGHEWFTTLFFRVSKVISCLLSRHRAVEAHWHMICLALRSLNSNVVLS